MPGRRLARTKAKKSKEGYEFKLRSKAADFTAGLLSRLFVIVPQ